jgi:hypothetical protein
MSLTENVGTARLVITNYFFISIIRGKFCMRNLIGKTSRE